MGKYDALFDEEPTPTPSPGGGGKYQALFDDTTDTSGSGISAPVSTPATNAAVSEPVGQPAYQSREEMRPKVDWNEPATARLVQLARAPSPEWMQPAEKFITETPLAPKEMFPAYWAGKEAQWASKYLPGNLGQVAEAVGGASVGAAQAASGVTTPAGLGFIATAPFTGPAMTALATGVFLGMAVKGTPDQWERLKAAPSIFEKSQIAVEMASSYLPAVALPGFKRLLSSRARDLTGAAVAPPEEQAPGVERPDVIIPPPPMAPEEIAHTAPEPVAATAPAAATVPIKPFAEGDIVDVGDINSRMVHADERPDGSWVTLLDNGPELGRQVAILEPHNVEGTAVRVAKIAPSGTMEGESIRTGRSVESMQAVAEERAIEARDRQLGMMEAKDRPPSGLTDYERSRIAAAKAERLRSIDQANAIEGTDPSTAARIRRQAKAAYSEEIFRIGRREEEGGANATRIESAGPVPELEVRPPVGKETSLRGKPKGAAAAGPQPGPTGEAVAPGAPEANASPELEPYTKPPSPGDKVVWRGETRTVESVNPKTNVVHFEGGRKAPFTNRMKRPVPPKETSSLMKEVNKANKRAAKTTGPAAPTDLIAGSLAQEAVTRVNKRLALPKDPRKLAELQDEGLAPTREEIQTLYDNEHQSLISKYGGERPAAGAQPFRDINDNLVQSVTVAGQPLEVMISPKGRIAFGKPAAGTESSLGRTGVGAFKTMNEISPVIEDLMRQKLRENPNQTFSFGASGGKIALYQRYLKKIGVDAKPEVPFEIPQDHPLREGLEPPAAGAETEQEPATKRKVLASANKSAFLPGEQLAAIQRGVKEGAPQRGWEGHQADLEANMGALAGGPEELPGGKMDRGPAAAPTKQAPPPVTRQENIRPPVQNKTPDTPSTHEALGWDEATQHGRDWLGSGGDINRVVADYRKNLTINSWDMGKLQAHMEKLQDATNRAGDALRKNPSSAKLREDFGKAAAQEKEFSGIYKSARTQASHTLPLEGHIPLDENQAASATGLARRFKEIQGKDMTARDQVEADSIARKTAEANVDYLKKNGDVYKAMDDEYSKMKSDRGDKPPTDQDLRSTFTEPKDVC